MWKKDADLLKMFHFYLPLPVENSSNFSQNMLLILIACYVWIIKNFLIIKLRIAYFTNLNIS